MEQNLLRIAWLSLNEMLAGSILQSEQNQEVSVGQGISVDEPVKKATGAISKVRRDCLIRKW